MDVPSPTVRPASAFRRTPVSIPLIPDDPSEGHLGNWIKRVRELQDREDRKIQDENESLRSEIRATRLERQRRRTNSAFTLPSASSLSLLSERGPKDSSSPYDPLQSTSSTQSTFLNLTSSLSPVFPETFSLSPTADSTSFFRAQAHTPTSASTNTRENIGTRFVSSPITTQTIAPTNTSPKRARPLPSVPTQIQLSPTSASSFVASPITRSRANSSPPKSYTSRSSVSTFISGSPFIKHSNTPTVAQRISAFQPNYSNAYSMSYKPPVSSKPQSLATFIGGRLEKAPLHKLKNADEDLEVPVINWTPKSGTGGGINNGPMGRSLADMIGGKADGTKLNKYMVGSTTESVGSAHATSKAPVAMPGMVPPPIGTGGKAITAPAPKSPKVQETVEKLEGMVEKDDFELSPPQTTVPLPSGNGGARQTGKVGIPEAFRRETVTGALNLSAPVAQTPNQISTSDEKGGFVRSHVKKLSAEVLTPAISTPVRRNSNPNDDQRQTMSQDPSTPVVNQVRRLSNPNEDQSRVIAKQPSFVEARPLPTPTATTLNSPLKPQTGGIRTSPQAMTTGLISVASPLQTSSTPKKSTSFSETRLATGLSKPLTSPEPKGSTFAFVPPSNVAPAFRKQESVRDDTPSLTRLKGSNIVKQRLGAWGNGSDANAGEKPKKQTALRNWERSNTVPKISDIYPTEVKEEKVNEPVSVISTPNPTSIQNTNELVQEMKEQVVSAQDADSIGKSSGTTLVHLTKGRARGPKKSAHSTSATSATAPITTISSDAKALQPEPPQAFNTVSETVTTKVAEPPTGVTARWGNQAPIGVKQVSMPVSSKPLNTFKPPVSNVKGVALPGMTRALPIPKSSSEIQVTSMGRPLPSPGPPSPQSTGRPLPKPVESRSLPTPIPKPSFPPTQSEEAINRPNVKDTIASWGRQPQATQSHVVLPQDDEKVEVEVSGKLSAQRTSKFKVPSIGRLPSINVQTLLSQANTGKKFDGTTISIECFAVNPSTSNAVELNPPIFYESELIAVVHRYKKDTLVNTRVLTWQGLKWNGDVKAKRRLEELTLRYRANAIESVQGREHPELVDILGSMIVIRQGDREHYDPLNSGMYCVRELPTGLFIDQIALRASSFSSAASFVICLLSRETVWHGKGSTGRERRAAETFAQSLNGESLDVIEEGAESSLFWQMLEKEDYASASHWRFSDVQLSQNLYSFSDNKAIHLPLHTLPTPLPSLITLYDTGLELYVLVPEDCRSQRSNIAMALQAGKDLSVHTGDVRPFKSPLHVLVFPSVVPRDLEWAARGIDFEEFNGGKIPKKMNIFEVKDAQELLSRDEFEMKECEDLDFLPLGIGPEDLQGI